MLGTIALLDSGTLRHTDRKWSLGGMACILSFWLSGDGETRCW